MNPFLRSHSGRNGPPTSTPASDSDEEIIDVEPDSDEEVTEYADTTNCPPGMTREFVRYPCGKGQYYYYLGRPKRGKMFRSAASAWRYYKALVGEDGGG